MLYIAVIGHSAINALLVERLSGQGLSLFKAWTFPKMRFEIFFKHRVRRVDGTWNPLSDGPLVMIPTKRGIAERGVRTESVLLGKPVTTPIFRHRIVRWRGGVDGAQCVEGQNFILLLILY